MSRRLRDRISSRRERVGEGVASSYSFELDPDDPFGGSSTFDSPSPASSDLSMSLQDDPFSFEPVGMRSTSGMRSSSAPAVISGGKMSSVFPETSFDDGDVAQFASMTYDYMDGSGEAARNVRKMLVGKGGRTSDGETLDEIMAEDQTWLYVDDIRQIIESSDLSDDEKQSARDEVDAYRALQSLSNLSNDALGNDDPYTTSEPKSVDELRDGIRQIDDELSDSALERLAEYGKLITEKKRESQKKADYESAVRRIETDARNQAFDEWYDIIKKIGGPQPYDETPR